MITTTDNIKSCTGDKIRLVYANGSVIDIIYGSDLTVTTTVNEIAEFSSKEEALLFIKDNGISYTEGAEEDNV